MDSLLRALKKTKINDPLDEVIEQLNKVEITISPNQEWDRLFEFFNKLQYLKGIKDNFLSRPYTEISYHDEMEFIKALQVFLDKLDELNQYYLQNIDWAAGDEKETAIDVKKLLERSLSDNRIYYKFDLIYDAYEMMIYIIDPEGNEPPIPICDQKFLNKFESIKKRKYDDI